MNNSYAILTTAITANQIILIQNNKVNKHTHLQRVRKFSRTKYLLLIQRKTYTHLKAILTGCHMTSKFHTSADIHTMNIGNTISDTPIQICFHLPDHTAAEKDPRIEVTVVPVTLTILRRQLIIQPLSHVNFERYTQMIRQLFDLPGVHIGCVRNQQKIIVVIKVIVSDILNDMEWSEILSGVGEAHYVLQFERGLHVLRINEEFYLIH